MLQYTSIEDIAYVCDWLKTKRYDLEICISDLNIIHQVPREFDNRYEGRVRNIIRKIFGLSDEEILSLQLRQYFSPRKEDLENEVPSV